MIPHDPDPPPHIVPIPVPSRVMRVAKRTGKTDLRHRQRRPTLPTLMEAFIAERASHGRSYLREKAGRLYALVLWCREQRIDPVHVTADDLSRFRTWMWSSWTNRAGKPYAYHPKRHALSLMRDWYRWLVQRGHRPDDPTAASLSLVADADPSSKPTARFIHTPLYPLMHAFLDHHRQRGRTNTVVSVDLTLRQFASWCMQEHIDPLRLTRPQADAYLVWLSTARTRTGALLARQTVSSRIGTLVAWYDWLEIRGDIIANPAAKLRVRVTKSRVVISEQLSLQEAIAVVQTQAQIVLASPAGSYLRARRMRLLAAICLCLATGRRIGGLLAIQVQHLDVTRCELRVEREKGRVGRIVPVAEWAIAVVKTYLADARPLLLAGRDLPWLFVGNEGAVTQASLGWALEQLITQTIAANPDLEALPSKSISWHSLRVSYATMLFSNGCPIRSVNELMLHSCLSTTARYTPIPIDDMHRIWRTAHPRP